MFQLSVESDLKRMEEQLKEIAPERLPRLISKALNNTAKDVLVEYQQAMPSIFDNPTPFTINSMRIDYANDQKLSVGVTWKDGGAGKYLQPEVFGGNRPQKNFERALQLNGLMPAGYVCVPTSIAPKDSYGNVPAATYRAILTYLQANSGLIKSQQAQQVKTLTRKGFGNLALGVVKQAYKTATTNKIDAARKQQAREKKQLKYFTAVEGQGTTLASGIWMRDQQLGNAIELIFAFIPHAHYHQSFPFQQIGDTKAQQAFPQKLDEAIKFSLAGK